MHAEPATIVRALDTTGSKIFKLKVIVNTTKISISEIFMHKSAFHVVTPRFIAFVFDFVFYEMACR